MTQPRQTSGWLRSPAWGREPALSDYSPATQLGQVAKLWLYYEKATGSKLNPRDQFSTSSCVGQATATGVDVLFGVQVAGLGRGAMPYSRVDATTIYAGSRVEYAEQVLGRRMRGKGSHVPYAAEFIKSYGVLFMKQYPSVDLSAFDANLCNAWERKGVPDDLEPTARLTPVKDWMAVKNVDEAVVALTNGWPVVIGCSYGFKSQPVRDQDGFLKPKGTWRHAQCYIGCDLEYSRPGLCCMNSWGNRWLSSDNARGGIPDGSYWIDLNVANDMIEDGEAVALSNVQGLTPQPIRYQLL